MFYPTKQQWIRIIISMILAAIVVIFYILYNDHTGILFITITSGLLIAIVGFLTNGFSISAKSGRKAFIYYLASFPLLLSLLILAILYGTGFSTLQPLFTADMWFVVLASLGAIFVIYYTERRIDKLESRLDSAINTEKINIHLNNNQNSHMRGRWRLSILIIIAIVGGIIVVGFANHMISKHTTADPAASSTIIAGEITFLGIIFTTVYKEVSTYYKDKSERVNKRWELVLPMIKDNYMPWISAAKSLSNSFKNVQSGNATTSQINRIMFLFAIFYGIRLRNLQKNGGYILLSSSEEEELVDNAYQRIKKVLDWAGDETPNRLNELQELFIKNEKDNNPYSIVRFEADLGKYASLQESKKKLEHWLKPEKAKNAQVALDNFVNVFNQSIKKLSSYWDT